jgi:hypothetical protein
MKIGRNSPCPCGSGKKYKHCCSEKRSTGQIVLDDIIEAAEEREFASLEELNAFAQQRMEMQNKRPLAEFCGLSPEQMSRLLYTPFTAPETVRFAPDAGSAGESGIMRIFMPLAEAINEGGLKATAKGNLPLKFCKAMAEQLKQQENGIRRLLIGGIGSEVDLDPLHCTRLTAQLAGLIRKYRGKFVLTRKGRDMLALEDHGGIYFELFKAYATQFNWGFRDGYPEAPIVQHAFLYTLFLLGSFGAAERPQRFYEDGFLAAFPMALDMFPESSYRSTEDSARRCYFLRSLERFAEFFGLAELTSAPGDLFREKCQVRKTALLDRFVRFSA